MGFRTLEEGLGEDIDKACGGASTGSKAKGSVADKKRKEKTKVDGNPHKIIRLHIPVRRAMLAFYILIVYMCSLCCLPVSSFS